MSASSSVSGGCSCSMGLAGPPRPVPQSTSRGRLEMGASWSCCSPLRVPWRRPKVSTSSFEKAKTVYASFLRALTFTTSFSISGK